MNFKLPNRMNYCRVVGRVGRHLTGLLFSKLCSLSHLVRCKIIISNCLITEWQLAKIIHSCSHIPAIEFHKCQFTFQKSKKFRLNSKAKFKIKALMITAWKIEIDDLETILKELSTIENLKTLNVKYNSIPFSDFKYQMKIHEYGLNPDFQPPDNKTYHISPIDTGSDGRMLLAGLLTLTQH